MTDLSSGALARMHDAVRLPTGTLEWRAWRRGVLIEHVIEHNLVVDTSKTCQSRLIGGDVTNKSVTQVGFGTNGTAPVAGNTALTGAYVKALDSHSYPSASSVAFALSLGTGEANGIAILEFGLLAADGTLFARKTRSTALNKDSDITLSATWTIQF